MALKAKMTRRNNADKEASIAEVTKEKTKRLNVEIPKSHHDALKKMAIDLDTTIADLVNQWIIDGMSERSNE